LRSITTLAATILILSLVVSCGSGEADRDVSRVTADDQPEAAGELRINTNGEDFVRSGFVSSDGWHITFRHFYVTLTDITVYQTDPPYDPHSGEEIEGIVRIPLDGTFTLDLAEGDESAEPLLTGTLDNVPAGHYNAMSWTMIPSVEGPSEGYSIYIDAQAEKGDQSYNVRLGFEESFSYRAGEYIGDERKGFVNPGGSDELEITFHVDHLFGDIEQPEDCELNVTALGFAPFAELMQEGTVEEDLASLSEKMPEETYTRLKEILPTLGHSGEGHCYCTVIQ